MMTSLCEKYWQFMLAQGVLLGISMGLLQFPTMAAVMQYFDKNIAAALGAAVAGSSIGGVVIPIALSKMLNSTSLGFGWSVRIIGFVITPLLAFACLTVKARLPPRKTTFFIPSAFAKVEYCLLVASMFFMFLGFFTPLFYIPTYAVSRGMDATLASYLLAILNAASTFGRVIPGVLADKFGRLNVLALGGTITGIIIFCMNKPVSNPALIVYSVVFGFWSGTIVSGATAALSILIPDPRVSGTYIGMALGVSSIAALIGPPVNGALLNKYHGFLEVSILSGTTCVFGGILAFLIKMKTPQGLMGRV
jgi:MFS family permease